MLKVHTRKLGDVTILCLRGGVVAGETAILRNAVQSQGDVSVVVLDFTRVNRIDAGGLGALLELREDLQAKGIKFRLMNVTKLVHQILQITRLDSVFEVSSPAEVLSAVALGRSATVVEIEPCPV